MGRNCGSPYRRRLAGIVVFALVAVFQVAVPVPAGASTPAGWTGPSATALPAVPVDSVSCVSSSFCTAGSYYSASVGGSQLATYNGSAWKVSYTDTEHRCSGCVGSTMDTVQCLTTFLCYAIDNQGDFLTYNGTKWSLDYENTDLYWGALSCPTTSFCVVGDAFGNVWTLNGTTWTGPTFISTGVVAQPWSSASFPDGISQISCPPGHTSFCVAIDNSGYAMTLTDGTWSAPKPIASSYLVGVSCATTTFCVATDNTGDVVSYNGSGWTVKNISAAGTEVSCPSSSFCLAADGSGNVYYFNGSSWMSSVALDPGNSIDSVSCPSASFCAVVDSVGQAFFFTPGTLGGATVSPFPGSRTVAVSGSTSFSLEVSSDVSQVTTGTLTVSQLPAGITAVFSEGGTTLTSSNASSGTWSVELPLESGVDNQTVSVHVLTSFSTPTGTSTLLIALASPESPTDSTSVTLTVDRLLGVTNTTVLQPFTVTNQLPLGTNVSCQQPLLEETSVTIPAVTITILGRTIVIIPATTVTEDLPPAVTYSCFSVQQNLFVVAPAEQEEFWIQNVVLVVRGTNGQYFTISLSAIWNVENGQTIIDGCANAWVIPYVTTPGSSSVGTCYEPVGTRLNFTTVSLPATLDMQSIISPSAGSISLTASINGVTLPGDLTYGLPKDSVIVSPGWAIPTGLYPTWTSVTNDPELVLVGQFGGSTAVFGPPSTGASNSGYASVTAGADLASEGTVSTSYGLSSGPDTGEHSTNSLWTCTLGGGGGLSYQAMGAGKEGISFVVNGDDLYNSSC